MYCSPARLGYGMAGNLSFRALYARLAWGVNWLVYRGKLTPGAVLGLHVEAKKIPKCRFWGERFRG